MYLLASPEGRALISTAIRLLLLVGAVMLVGGAPTDAAPNSKLVVEAEVGLHTVFYKSGSPEWEDLPLVSHLTPAELSKIIPYRPGLFGLVEFRCDGIQPDRHLSGCKIDVAPEGVGYERAGKLLLDSITVDPVYDLSKRAEIEFISADFRLSNSDLGIARVGPCWGPPFCSAVPAPSPPPPPPQHHSPNGG